MYRYVLAEFGRFGGTMNCYGSFPIKFKSLSIECLEIPCKTLRCDNKDAFPNIVFVIVMSGGGLGLHCFSAMAQQREGFTPAVVGTFPNLVYKN